MTKISGKPKSEYNRKEVDTSQFKMIAEGLKMISVEHKRVVMAKIQGLESGDILMNMSMSSHTFLDHVSRGRSISWDYECQSKKRL